MIRRFRRTVAGSRLSLTAIDRRRDLALYEIATGKLTRIGDGTGIDSNPAWSSDGKYLYFISSRHENPVGSDVDFDFAILKSAGIYAIPLARDTASPVAPKSDEGSGSSYDSSSAQPDEAKHEQETKPGKHDNDKKKDDSAAEPVEPVKPGPIKPIRIDLDGLMARAVAVPVDAANITQLDLRGDRIFYLTQPLGLIDGMLAGEKSELRFYDLKTRKSSTVTEDVDAYSLSRDGLRVLIRHEKDYTVLATKADAAKDAETKKPLKLDHLRELVDPRQEWAEMFENAWRLERDLFYSPPMNGVDWKGVHDHYRALLPLAGSREDLNYLIGQMLGEISNSHTYVGGGDDGDTTPQAHSALLGVDWALDAASGRYRFATIYPGDNTRSDYRSPLAQPGLNVKTGDYLLAVNGAELKAPTDPDSLLQLADADTTVELTIADRPDGARRQVVVTPVAKELSLRESAWIAHNREVVDKLSGGRVGYVYMSDMEQLGLQQFVRQFYAQLGKQALIMDDRWNGGGFIAPFAIERLRRMLVALGDQSRIRDFDRAGGGLEWAQSGAAQSLVGFRRRYLPVSVSPLRPRQAGRDAFLGRRARNPRQLAIDGRRLRHDSRGRALHARQSMGGREPWSRPGRRGREPARRFARRPRCAARDGGRPDAQGDRR